MAILLVIIHYLINERGFAMGIGAWRPNKGQEGFVVSLSNDDVEDNDFESMAGEEVSENLSLLCEAAGLTVDGSTSDGNDGIILASNDHVKIHIRGWESDIAVSITPLVEPYSDNETLICMFDSESLPEVFNELQSEHMLNIKNLLVNGLIDQGYDCRFATSGYTSNSYEKAADFDLKQAAKMVEDYKLPSLTAQIAQISSPNTGGAGRHDLLESIANEGSTPAIGVIPVLHEGYIYFAGLGAQQAMDIGGDHNCLAVNLLTIESEALIGQELIYCAHEAVEELGESCMPTVLNDKWRETLNERIIKPYLKTLETKDYGSRNPIIPIILSDTEVAEHWGNSFNNLAFPEMSECEATDLSGYDNLEFSEYDQLFSAGSVEIDEGTTLVIIPVKQAQVLDLALKAEASSPNL